MEKEIKNNCGGKRGCSVVIILPHDSGIEPVLSSMYGIRNDIQKILSLAHISLDKVVEKEGQMDKAAA